MDFKEYEKKVKELEDKVLSLKLKKEEQEALLALIADIRQNQTRVTNMFLLNKEVYEKEKEILLNHFIEKDNELNEVYYNLTGFQASIFYKMYIVLKKCYHKIRRKKD